MVVVKLPDEGCGVKTNELPTTSKSGHAQEQQQPEQAATESNLSLASTNLESILFNYLPAQENILKHISLKDLLNMREVSSYCRAAVHCYLGAVKTIYENRGQFDGVDTGDLSVILPHTRSLQTFTSRKFIDYDVTTLLANNPKLRVLSKIATPQFHNYLTSFTSKLESLSAINLENRDGEKMNDQYIPQFCAKLSELCPNLSHLWLSMSNEVFNDDSLTAIGGLNSLENLSMEKVTIRGRLSNLLSNCPKLARLIIGQCRSRSDADLLKDISQHCSTLDHFQFISDEIKFLDANGVPDYCDVATNIVIANPKLQSFRFLCGHSNTCDGKTLDAMTDHLENVKQLAFCHHGGFPELGDNFRQFADKFQYLSHLSIISPQISQEWLNVIGSNCSNLEFLSLIESYSYQLTIVFETLGGVDITQICNRNKKLIHIAMGLRRGITLDSCQSLTTLDLKYIRLILPSSSPGEEFHRILSTRFALGRMGKRNTPKGGFFAIEKKYLSTDDVFNFPNCEY